MSVAGAPPGWAGPVPVLAPVQLVSMSTIGALEPITETDAATDACVAGLSQVPELIL